MILFNSQNITNIIERKVMNKDRLSMVRLGDGEFIIIKYPKFTPVARCKARINRWFDADKLTLKEVKTIRNLIYKACRNADILGVPSVRERRQYGKWKNFCKMCFNYNLFWSKQIYYHFYQVVNLDYRKILRHTDMIFCITCRDIRKELERAFNVKVKLFLIPPEKFTYKRKGNNPGYNKYNGKPHYPDLYLDILKWIDSNPVKGRVCLIGAGGLGKYYCMRVKERGGIGLDIGALFDGWAGIKTRPYLKQVQRIG